MRRALLAFLAGLAVGYALATAFGTGAESTLTMLIHALTGSPYVG